MSFQNVENGVVGTQVQDISDNEVPHIPNQEVRSPAPFDRASMSPLSESEIRQALEANGFGKLLIFFVVCL